MSNARPRLAVAGETMSSPRAPFFPKAQGISRFAGPRHAHGRSRP